MTKAKKDSILETAFKAFITAGVSGILSYCIWISTSIVQIKITLTEMKGKFEAVDKDSVQLRTALYVEKKSNERLTTKVVAMEAILPESMRKRYYALINSKQDEE